MLAAAGLAVGLASSLFARPAYGADDEGKKDEPSADAEKKPADEKNSDEKGNGKKRLEDATRKRASVETAGYIDTNNVAVLTPSVSASVENVTAGASLKGSYLVDVVSAASPDIVSTASRRWQEVRQAGSLGGAYKPHEFGVNAAASFSNEPDYLSYGGGGGISQDFDEKNWTLTLGFGYSKDTIGRHGTPLSVFSREVNRESIQGGAAWVVNPSTLASAALDLVFENGDQSKPYRYIPMFAPSVAAQAPLGASIDWVTANRQPERPLEQLPLSRRRAALSIRLAHRFDGSTLKLDERAYYDSWGLFASTSDVRWIFDVTRRFNIGPHARFHVQNAVSFWQRAYAEATAPRWNLPEFRTGDREMGPLWTATGGLGMALFVGGASEPSTWAVRLQVDGMYTSFLDDLYVTQRSGTITTLVLEAEL